MTLLSSAPARTSVPIVAEDPGRHQFRVHRDSMTSPAIFAAEIARIFNHSWLYVGHESEVREPGDYVRRPLGGRPVF
ncbi:MAG TPA: hypothetical protein VG164_01380, partial [Trebonia sp.]|nr:hypothetical protein [Trebonia sp.]